MAKYRSILASVLALVAVLFICSGNPALAKTKAKTLTYTPEQLEEIQGYASEVATLSDRLSELQTLIQKEDWTYVRNFIHGPLGELRLKMGAVTRNLLPDARKQAQTIARAVSDDLVAIDRSAEQANYKLTVLNYGKTARDLNAFLQLVPKA